MLITAAGQLQWNRFRRTLNPEQKGFRVKGAGAVDTDYVLSNINSCEGKKSALLMMIREVARWMDMWQSKCGKMLTLGSRWCVYYNTLISTFLYFKIFHIKC